MPEVPKFDYRSHPEITTFKSSTRVPLENPNDSLLPVLGIRADAADSIHKKVIEVPTPDLFDPRLLIHPADQGLLLTPFDNFEGMEPKIPSDEVIETWKLLHEYNLQLANAPSRILAMKAIEERGFQPPPPIDEDNVVEDALHDGIILQLSDLGQNVDLRYLNDTLLEKWSDMSKEDREEAVSELRGGPQVHRSEQFALGVPVMLGRQARSFFGGGAMPDMNGSVLSLATQAMMHMRVDIPEVGYFSDPKKGAALARAVFEYLNNHPMLKNYSPDDQEWLKKHWKANIFGALEVGTDKALRRAEVLAHEGVNSFRIYGHTQGSDIIDTTAAMRREYPDADLAASQITDVAIAFGAWEYGADSIITGVGSGGRCTTADQAQSISANALFPILCRKYGLGIPIIGEGGAIEEPIIAASVGLSGVNGSGSIAGGTFEAPGGWVFLYINGDYYKPYGGEASPRTKWLSDRTFPTGLPYFKEGEQTFKKLIPEESSICQKVINHQQRFILGPVMMRIDATPYVIEKIHNLYPSPLYRKSPTTFELQKTH